MNIGVTIGRFTSVGKRLVIEVVSNPPEVVTAMTAIEQWISDLKY